MSYRAIVLPAEAAAFVAEGGRDLALARLGAAGEGLDPGRPLRLVDAAGAPLGVAVADPENGRLRVFGGAAEADAALDAAFFRARVERAIALRRALGLWSEAPGGRAIHGAGDGLPGFAADVLGGWAVLYVYGRGLVHHGRFVADALRAAGALRGVVLKVRSRGAVHQRDVRQEIIGETPPERLVVEEHGVPFEVHLLGGLNTGLFTDMRVHRHGLARFVAGRDVLNGFAYTGTLSVLAARSGAASVTSVDLSSGVLAWAADNFRGSSSTPTT